MVGGGATWGMFWGLLFGLLFFIPVFGMAVGAGMGALMGKITKSGVDKAFQDQVRGMLEPGTSCLFLMVEKVTPDKAVEAMSKYGGTVLKTSLSKEGEQELQDALHGGHRLLSTRLAQWPSRRGSRAEADRERRPVRLAAAGPHRDLPVLCIQRRAPDHRGADRPVHPGAAAGACGPRRCPAGGRWSSASSPSPARQARSAAALTGTPAGEGAAELWKALVLLMTAVVVVRRVLAKPTVTIQSIYGALSAYLIVGLMFAACYAAIQRLDTGISLPATSPPTPRRSSTSASPR